MNRTRVMAYVCSMALSTLLAGCGGGNNSSSATIAGTVTGLSAGTSVVLLNNGTNSLTVSANGSFHFSNTIGSNDSYNVTVATQPVGQSCLISNGSGTINYAGDSVGNVAVDCSANVSIDATVTGLQGAQSATLQLTLQNNPDIYSATFTAGSTETAFTDSKGSPVPLLPLGALYSISVLTQPTGGETCTYAGGSPASGGVVNANPINADFACSSATK